MMCGIRTDNLRNGLEGKCAAGERERGLVVGSNSGLDTANEKEGVSRESGKRPPGAGASGWKERAEKEMNK